MSERGRTTSASAFERMSLNGTDAPAAAPATVEGGFLSESEASDPATRAMREGASTGWWWSSREKAAQIIPRVDGYPFDPYTKANVKPELYFFEVASPTNRKYFDQIRRDDGQLGQLAATAAVPKRVSIREIVWHKRSHCVLDFKMFDYMGLTVANGYVKKTAYAGKARWVVVVTKLHKADLPETQGPSLFSAPLYEALATAVAFGMFNDHEELARLYPDLAAGRPRDGDRKLKREMAHNARQRGIERRAAMGTKAAPPSLEGPDAKLASAVLPSVDDATTMRAVPGVGLNYPPSGGEKAELAPTGASPAVPQAATESVPNYDAEQTHVYTRYDTAKRRSGGMAITPGLAPGIGVLYPLRTPGANLQQDAMVVQRVAIEAQAVKVMPDPNKPPIKGFKRYTVTMFGSHDDEKASATLNVTPLLYPSTDQARPVEYLYHKVVPMAGTAWVIPGVEEVEVAESDVDAIGGESVPYDEGLAQAIETGVHKLLADDDFAVVIAGQE